MWRTYLEMPERGKITIFNRSYYEEVVIVREYAPTGAQLTAKQMAFTRSAFPAIAQAVVDAMDEMSMPFQELGLEQMAEYFETVEGGRKPPGKK